MTHRLWYRDEGGFAIITVTLASVVLLLIVAASVAYASGQRDLSRHDQDWNAALAAAQAGIDDYIFHLDQNSNYWQYTTTAASPDHNAALSGWTSITGDSSLGQFQYSVDTSNITSGSVGLTASGKVRSTVRSVKVTLRQASYLDDLYFTDFETKDPSLYQNPPDPINATQAQTQCGGLYWYTGRSSAGNCTQIFFASGDKINGPLHSNDAISISGTPEFVGQASDSWNSSPGWVGDPNNTNNPSFDAGPFQYVAPIPLPQSNAFLKALADPSVGGTGCMFTGPTNIVLNSAGTMTVTSPDTKQSNCGTFPLASAQTMALPSNGVVYVQSVPTSTTDPNYSPACSSHPLGYPLVSGDITTYGCADGDAFVSGTLKGQLTIGTQTNIWVTGNVTYNGTVTNGTESGTDILGLMASNAVTVYHPVTCGGSCSNGTGSTSNLTIDAAIVGLNHTFIVANYQDGNPLSNLTINGSIAQKYRGPVGTFNSHGAVSGYQKAYSYDGRLKYLSPPHMLDVAQTAWQIKVWSEIEPAAS